MYNILSLVHILLDLNQFSEMSLTTRTSETIHLYPQYIGKIGVVQDFTTNGDVVVEYRDIRWRYNPAVLSKVMLTQSFVSPRASSNELTIFVF